MLVSEYDGFVQRTDWSSELPGPQRLEVATYGLVSEIGSVVAALKKRILARGSGQPLVPDEELVAELGDVIWYCFSLARLANSKPVNILLHDVRNLRREIGATTRRAREIANALPAARRKAFLEAAEKFSTKTRGMQLDSYQSLAFMTARTEGETLLKVCVAVLVQLSAQLLRQTLPTIERGLNRQTKDKPINDLLGETAWHISAIATLFELKLSEIALANVRKISQRYDRHHRTPLPDEGFPLSEQFPRKFDVAFLSVGPGRSRMYVNGLRLGDELTDNSYDEDGYRFHDVMHLAYAGVLGWSPVLRHLMGRKRKSNPRVDEVEDGARARIVEEALIKVIHSEGERLAQRSGRGTTYPSRMYPSSSEVSFALLNLISNFVRDLEVERNSFAEWEKAILLGDELFHRLRTKGQGTVTVDLNLRALTFSPDVFVPLAGRVSGLSTATAADLENSVLNLAEPTSKNRVNALFKLAALKALGMGATAADYWQDLKLKTRTDDDIVSASARGDVQKRMWDRSVVAFRISGNEDQATAIALSDG